MSKWSNRKIGIRFTIITLFLIAYIPSLLWWGYGVALSDLSKLLRAIIYPGLFILYTVSLHKRIIQVQARRFLINMMFLLLFWFVVREIKYNLVLDPDITRYLWYSYYIPMLMLPTLFFLVALTLGKPEQYRLPKWVGLFPFISILLIAVVLTNEFHQWVFAFPGELGRGEVYRYHIAYWFVLGWELLLALAALVILFQKSRIPRSRKIRWLPLLPMGIGLIYCILYITAFHLVRLFARDITVFICLFYIATLESCIKSRLIQSNTHYKELFDASSVGAQITDKNFHPLYFTKNARPIETKDLIAAAQQPLILNQAIRFSAAPIRRGYVFWQEDISPLLDVLTKLESTHEELQSYRTLLQEENKEKKRRKKLEEQKRLYNTMCEKTATQMNLVLKLATDLENSSQEETARKLLAKIAVIGAYLKRRSNLVLLSEQKPVAPSKELSLCLQESGANLRLCGVNYAFQSNFDNQISLTTAGLFYDFYEAVVEATLDSLTDLIVALHAENGGYRISLMLRCHTDITQLSLRFPNASLSQEADVWYCSMPASEGGTFL